MRVAINFNPQINLGTIEIENKGADPKLTTEFEV